MDSKAAYKFDLRRAFSNLNLSIQGCKTLRGTAEVGLADGRDRDSRESLVYPSSPTSVSPRFRPNRQEQQVLRFTSWSFLIFQSKKSKKKYKPTLLHSCRDTHLRYATPTPATESWLVKPKQGERVFVGSSSGASDTIPTRTQSTSVMQASTLFRHLFWQKNTISLSRSLHALGPEQHRYACSTRVRLSIGDVPHRRQLEPRKRARRSSCAPLESAEPRCVLDPPSRFGVSKAFQGGHLGEGFDCRIDQIIFYF